MSEVAELPWLGRWLHKHPKLVAWVDARLEASAVKARVIRWEPHHNNITFGRNGFSDEFFVQHLGIVGKEWQTTVHPPCPDGRRFCTCQDRKLYATDVDAAKSAAQTASNDRGSYPPAVGG